MSIRPGLEGAVQVEQSRVRDGEQVDGEPPAAEPLVVGPLTGGQVDGEQVDGEPVVDGGAVEDAAGRLSMAIARLVRSLRRGSPSGIGPGSLSALATVVRHGPLRLGDLAVKEGITPPTLSRIMAGLEEGGYVTRTPDPTDGRATRAEATEAAVDLINGAGSSRAEVLRARMAALPPADLAALLRAVPVLEALATDEG